MPSEILIYQTEDGKTIIQTRLENETVWLSQEQMAELFQRDRSVISKHIGNIFSEGELEEKVRAVEQDETYQPRISLS